MAHENYWYCHGCHATGDVIDFVARTQRISKGQAIRVLAERYGLQPGPPVTRTEGQYMRDTEARSKFWWTQKRAKAVAALESSCVRFFAEQSPYNEAVAVAAGAFLRMIDGIKPEIRLRAFITLRSRETDYWWDESRSEIRNLAAIFGASL